MRPLKLEMQGFGPYVQKQYIDFSVFKDGSLFLIRGETGSGKTMILDAITYALYGKSSGGQREDLESMRSRFAVDEEETYINYTFSLQERCYRFHRSVEVKPKKNLEKVYKVSVDAGELIDGIYYPFFENPKVKNIEEKAIEIIGLTHAQFIQVMILPQGKFERLLTSKSDEKQEILKTLFQMDRWGRINAYLIDKLKEERDTIDAKKQKIQGFLNSIQVTNYQDITLWLENTSVQVAKDQEILAQSKQNLQGKRKVLEKQTALYTWKKEQEEALQQQHLLQLQDEKMKQNKDFLIKQKQRMEVKPYVEAIKQATIQVSKRQENLDKAKQNYAQYQKEMLSRNEKEAQIKVHMEHITKLATQLDMLEKRTAVYEQYNSLKIMERTQKEKETHASAMLQQEETKFQQAIVLRDEIHNKIQELSVKLQPKEEKERLFTIMEQANFLYQKEEICGNDKTVAKQKQEQLLKRAENQRKRFDEVEHEHEIVYRQFLANSALQLVQDLKKDKPCPVCGSLHHPHPYANEANDVDVFLLQQLQTQMDKEKDVLEAILKDAQKEEVRVETLQQQQLQLQAEIQGLLKQSFSIEAYTLLQQEVQQLRLNEKKVMELQKNLDKGMQIVQEKEVAIQQAQVVKQALQVETKVLETKLINCEVQFIEGISSLSALSEMTQRIKSQMDKETKEVEQTRLHIQKLVLAYEKSKEDIKTCEVEVEQALKQETSAKEKFALQCELRHIQVEELTLIDTEANLQKLENDIQAYDVACVQIATTLHNVEEHLRGAVWLDLTALHKEVEQMEEQIDTRAKQLGQLLSTKKLYEQVQVNINHIQKEVDIQEPLFLKLQQFVRAMRGDNGIGIERYVLGVMLASITQSANQLLEHVHQGRYQIYRSDDASGRTRKYGLELRIYDAYTCSFRSVVSLSGGEKFLVSLALSLALAAVVQARNGGIHLDAMFIDEGFGTLDEHSIADALQVLQNMRSQKGLVGIISHVELLKENITAGIEVIKTRQGSRLLIRKD